MLIIDKCKGDREKALFYVRRTIQNGWSRSVLLNWLSTDLYERESKGQTNFELTMPSDECDLAKQLVKDPQVFEVFGLKDAHDEADLKSAIVANIERTLLARLRPRPGRQPPRLAQDRNNDKIADSLVRDFPQVILILV